MKKPTDRTTGTSVNKPANQSKSQRKKSIAIPEVLKKERLRWEYMRRSKKFGDRFRSCKIFLQVCDDEKLKLDHQKKNREILTAFGSTCFEEYWENYRQFWVEEIPKVFLPARVENFLEWLPQASKQIAEKEGRDPTQNDLLEVIAGLYPGQNRTLVLKIEMWHGTPEENRTILEKIKGRLDKLTRKTRFMEDELKRYLQVFDLKKAGMKWKEIFLEIYPERKDQDFTEDQGRALLMDNQKAKRIIKNLEDGKFYWWSLEGEK